HPRRDQARAPRVLSRAGVLRAAVRAELHVDRSGDGTSQMTPRRFIASCAAALVAIGGAACGSRGPKPGTVQDEAMRAGLTPDYFVAAADDYFHDMDFNLVGHQALRPFTQQEIEGRNTWLLWTGGNDRLWDRLTVDSLGTFDLLKTISSHRPVRYDDPHGKKDDPPKYLYGHGRRKRSAYLALTNQPRLPEA